MKNSKKDSQTLEDKPEGEENVLPAEKENVSAGAGFIRNVEELSCRLPLSEKEEEDLKEVAKKYRLKIPRYYYSLIENPFNPDDPIKRQCVPSAEELHDSVHEKFDPLAEERTSPCPFLVHRYPDRVLLLVTGRCFMYCRHCTRKRLWTSEKSEPTLTEIEKALEYVREDKRIREIIISGGDPLTLSNDRIDCILASIREIENVEAVRIGTRAPVVFPERIDSGLGAVLKKYDNIWVNVQFNHPREITPQSTDACRKIQQCGIPVSNQSVLLRGINDDSTVMAELCHKLQKIRVRPYYLFQCDPVVGTSHFRTSVFKGVEIIERMAGHTGGMCVPTFVVDGIDGRGKVPLMPNHLVSVFERSIILKNYRNEEFMYHNPGKENARPDVVTKDRKPTIGIVFNLKKNIDDERYEEYDEIETIESLKKEIEKNGFNVVLIEQRGDFSSAVASARIDFVLNIAEGVGNLRSRESQIPCILESMGIPYSGSDSISMGITLDKYLTNRTLKSAGIPVPEMYMVTAEEEIKPLAGIFKNDKIFIVKPRWEGSSKGIFSHSVIYNFDQLKENVNRILSWYKQPALVEEFLEGEEITMGLCGNNGSLRSLGMMRILPRVKSDKPFIYSIENKRDWQRRVRYESQDTIPAEVQSRIKTAGMKAFSALELRDIARMDFRMDKGKFARIIDVNPLPGLSPCYSDLPILYKLNGGDYAALIKGILKASFKRYGFDWM